MNVLGKNQVLILNSSWRPIAVKPPKSIIIKLYNGNVKGLDISWGESDVETNNFSTPNNIRIVGWDEWVNAPIRNFDDFIQTPLTKIRIPDVVICSSYSNIPRSSPRASKKNIMIRDNFTCQYTGIKYPRRELDIDHVIPRSKGGMNTWQNLVTCHKNINNKKGNKNLKEFGTKLIRKPFKPNGIDLFLNEHFYNPKWEPFIKKL